jgi:hypothetical protein
MIPIFHEAKEVCSKSGTEQHTCDPIVGCSEHGCYTAPPAHTHCPESPTPDSNPPDYAVDLPATSYVYDISKAFFN